MIINKCVSAVIRGTLVAGLCFTLAGCSTSGPESSIFEVVLNRDVRITLPLGLFENAMILDTFSVRFADGASLTFSALNLRDFNYLNDIRELPEYNLGLRDLDTENMDKEQVEEVLGVQNFIKHHVGGDGEVRIIDAPKGRVYAVVGEQNSIAYLTYLSSEDVIVYIDASNMSSEEFLGLIKEDV